jgi:hypothetical protein
MDTPQLHIWGPVFWRILHTLAEKTGRKQQIKAMRYDEAEKNLWICIFDSLRTSLPCPKCREHYRNYCTTNPYINIFIKEKQRNKIIEWTNDEKRQKLREWLYNLHEGVNIKKFREAHVDDKDAEYKISISLSDVESIYYTDKYTNVEFQADLQILKEQMRKGMFMRLYTRDDMLRTLSSLTDLWNRTL